MLRSQYGRTGTRNKKMKRGEQREEAACAMIRAGGERSSALTICCHTLPTKLRRAVVKTFMCEREKEGGVQYRHMQLQRRTDRLTRLNRCVSTLARLRRASASWTMRRAAASPDERATGRRPRLALQDSEPLRCGTTRLRCESLRDLFEASPDQRFRNLHQENSHSSQDIQTCLGGTTCPTLLV